MQFLTCRSIIDGNMFRTCWKEIRISRALSYPPPSEVTPGTADGMVARFSEHRRMWKVFLGCVNSTLPLQPNVSTNSVMCV